jgi:DNA-binding HxlR family transcriptional regulator
MLTLAEPYGAAARATTAVLPYFSSPRLACDHGADIAFVELEVGMLLTSVRPRCFCELLVRLPFDDVLARDRARQEVGTVDSPHAGNGSREGVVTIRSMAARTMNPVHEATSCAVAACAEIIGAKWTALLVHDLSEGPRRFSELEHSCVGISPRTLSERLRALEDEGIVDRHSYAESPPRVEYELTDKGVALLPIIDEMRRFGHAHLTE